MTMNKCLTILLACALTFATGCTKDTATSGSAKAAAPAVVKAFNAKCPMTGKAVDPKIATVAYQKQAIGFCCGQCPAKFAALSDADKAADLAKNGATLPK